MQTSANPGPKSVLLLQTDKPHMLSALSTGLLVAPATYVHLIRPSLIPPSPDLSSLSVIIVPNYSCRAVKYLTPGVQSLDCLHARRLFFVPLVLPLRLNVGSVDDYPLFFMPVVTAWTPSLN